MVKIPEASAVRGWIYIYMYIYTHIYRYKDLGYIDIDIRYRIHPRTDGERLRGILIYQKWMNKFYFTKKIVENCRCIVPNFINDEFISIIPFLGVLPLQFSTGPSKLFQFPGLMSRLPSVDGMRIYNM